MASNANINLYPHDDYMTPKYAWEDIQHLIPKGKTIWEPFYGDGKSGEFLKELGFDVIHQDIDFYANNLGELIVSNPPFHNKQAVFKRLKYIDKPFIMICPVSMLNTQYFRRLYKNNIKIIIPKKRLKFKKMVKGKYPKEMPSGCSFDCFYYCYKIDTLKDSITWLD